MNEKVKEMVGYHRESDRESHRESHRENGTAEKKGTGWIRYIRFRLSCWWEGARCFFHFIRRIPGFVKLNWMRDCEPDFYDWVIGQYQILMKECTGGKLSKPSHDAYTVIAEMWWYIDREYVPRPEMLEEMKKNGE